MIPLPTVTLVLAAAAALLNCWLTARVGRVRGKHKVSIGDGGNEAVIRRMRAHANFAENAPLLVLLVLVLELARGPSPWLWAAAALFVAARIAHGIGMDGWYPGRSAGTVTTLALQLALAGWALAIPLTARTTPPTTVEAVPARG